MQIVSIKTFTFRYINLILYGRMPFVCFGLWSIIAITHVMFYDSINRVSSSCHVSVNFVWLSACILNYVVAVVLVNWAQDKNW